MLKTAEINTQAITIEINLCFFTKRVNPAILRVLNSYDFTGRLFHASIIRSEKKHDVPLGNFQNSVPKEFITSPIHVLCANFVKFGSREVGEITRCLPDRKKNKISPRSISRSGFCGDRIQNLPGPAADNVLRVPQTSSK